MNELLDKLRGILSAHNKEPYKTGPRTRLMDDLPAIIRRLEQAQAAEWRDASELPITFQPILAVGMLQWESSSAVHEAFYDGKKWMSVREEPKLAITSVTHWRYMPEMPDTQSASQGEGK